MSRARPRRPSTQVKPSLRHLARPANATPLPVLSEGERDGVGVTIGFSTTTRLMSRLIRWVTRGRVSHAWVGFYDDTLGQRMVLQAERWGYEARPWKRWLTENLWVAEFETPLDDPVTERGVITALRMIARYLGVDYDYRAAFLSGVWRWLKLWWKKPTSTPGRLMCSEATLMFIGYTRLGGYEDLEPEVTSPADLLTRLAADKRFRSLSAPMR